MRLFRWRKKEEILCPNCKKPVADGTVFCDSCGLRLLPPPACAKCNLPLAPETNFCEACGTPVGAAPPAVIDSPAAASSDAPAQALTDRDKKEKTGKGKRSRKKSRAGTGPEGTGVEEKPADPGCAEPGAPENTIGSVSAEPQPGSPGPAPAGNAIPVPLAPPPGPALHPGSPGMPRKCRVIIGVLAGALVLSLCAVAALSGIVHLPHPTGGSGSAGEPVVVTGDTIVNEGIDTVVPQSAVTTVPVSTGPTQVPPERLEIWFQAERDPITSNVSVLYDGGKGQRAVRGVVVRLTRSDGQVLTGMFKPLTVGEGVVLPGTRYSDRLEVIVQYNNGEEYTVIDKLFEYKQRR